MATNLTTIQVQLLANAQNFKKNIDTAGRSVGKLKKATDKVTPSQKKFQDNLRNTAGAIAAVQGPLGPVAGRISSIGAIIGRVNPLTLAFLAGFTAIGVAIGKFISVGSRAESQLLKLEALLKATGGASRQTAEDLEALAVSIGRNTLASVQGARDAAGVLLTFKSISGDTFSEVLKLSQDLAAVGFGSIKTAALQLGKALEEPEIGLSALRRVGVSFTEEQKEQIKVLSLTGQQAKAQQLILKALKEQVGGAGVGAAGGLAGAFDTLGENITLFFEKSEAGKTIVSALTKLINGLANAFGKFVPDVEKLPDDLDTLNVRLKEQQVTTKALSIDFANLTKKLLAFKEQAGSAAKQRAVLTQKEIDKVNEQINQSVEEEKRIKEKIALLKKETDVIDKSKKFETEALQKIMRGRNKELRMLGKTRAEKRAIQDLDKLEQALISKLGEGVEARKKINEILEKNRGIRLAIAKIQVEEIERFERLQGVAEGVGSAFESAGKKISDAFVEGKLSSLDFRSVLRQLIIDIQKTLIQVLILDQIKKSITGAIETSGGISGIFKGIFGVSNPGAGTTGPIDRRSSGGAVTAGMPTLVGERGPELFVPRTAGAITPSSLTPGKMGGGTNVNISQNLNFATGIQNTVRAEVLNLLPQIQNSTIAAVADARIRGGKFAKAFGD